MHADTVRKNATLREESHAARRFFGTRAPASSTRAAGAPAGFDVPCINRFEISLKLPSFRSGNAPTKKRLHLMWEAHGCRVYVAHLVGLSVPPLKVEA